MILAPAYGRDYKSKAAVIADFEADKDFVIMDFVRDAGRYVNCSQLVGIETEVTIRYAKLTKVVIVKVPTMKV